MTKKITMILGVVFVLIGVLGFVNNPVIGLFAVDAVHNLVHIILGIILIMGSKCANPAKSLKIVGVIYAVVAILGFLMMGGEETTKLLGLVTVNGADNWLHLVLAIVLLAVGFKGGSAMPMASSTPSQPMGGMNNGQQM